jgi:hypothetical protein
MRAAMTDLFAPYAARKATENAPGLARTNGAQTSKDAADSIATVSGAKRVAVLRMLAVVQHPATAEELEYHTGFSGNTIRPRLVELADGRDGKAPLVRKTGEQAKTRAGRKADLWTITEWGHKALRHIDGKAE